MSNELQSLNARIAERIGKDLVELIPADQWQQLVDKEVERFTQDVAPQIIQDMMKEAYLNKAKGTIDTLISSQEWNDTTQTTINTELEQFIGQSAGNIFAGMLSPSMQIVLTNLRNQLGYNSPY